ncbi:hypothetical protein Pcinc_018315 [Petrolisthes cinctipes]|uniref:Uncharacterized protein n=1 Tax=Petrolisthes cinctipes TaxID=88211 RepID=A0AAE1FNC4_PETCI|nr:hypothetical protein Pcinc_018315 [Petrolisthes cinctipes]
MIQSWLIRNKDEAEAMLNNKKLSNKYEAIKELRRSKSENLEDNGPAFTGPDVPLEDQWELFTTLCHILHEQKRFEELERMTFSALGSKEFMRDKERAREMEFMCLLACIYNDSSYFAYNIMRELVIKNPEICLCDALLNKWCIRWGVVEIVEEDHPRRRREDPLMLFGS